MQKSHPATPFSRLRGYQGTASLGLDTDNSGDAHRHATKPMCFDSHQTTVSSHVVIAKSVAEMSVLFNTGYGEPP
jgi:hypothetical protein